MGKRYCVSYRTLEGWTSLAHSGGPDLKNNTRLLSDLFGWYLSISPGQLAKKKKRIGELTQTRSSLYKFRRYLGFTAPHVALMYGIKAGTYHEWEVSARAGSPDLKNHPVFLRDFFKWYFKDEMVKKDELQVTIFID